MRSAATARIAVALLALTAGLGACEGSCLIPALECFDPDDPCPNDMAWDDTGCVWDRCAGEFTGTPIPCWYRDPAYEVVDLLSQNGMAAGFALAGDRGQYLAYVRKRDDFGLSTVGRIYLYDMETGEHVPITDEGEMCTKPRGDGNILAWIEYTDFDDWRDRRSEPRALELAGGQRWEFSNIKEGKIDFLIPSGNWILATEVYSVDCLGGVAARAIVVFDLLSGDSILIADSVLGEYRVNEARMADGIVVYWKLGGFCTGSGTDQLWAVDVLGLERWLVADIGGSSAPSTTAFNFDGLWAVGEVGGVLHAWNVETLEDREIAQCYMGDCHVLMGGGYLVYDRYGEDGLDLWNLYAVNLATGEKQKLTNLRPYYDDLWPQSMLGNRVFWGERRGFGAHDICGNSRPATGVTWMWFWRDLDF